MIALPAVVWLAALACAATSVYNLLALATGAYAGSDYALDIRRAVVAALTLGAALNLALAAHDLWIRSLIGAI